MDVTAKTKFVKMSPTKARDLARCIQGKTVNDALRVLDFSSRKGAALLSKTLKSALGNAENNAKLPVDGLRVKRATVDGGPRMKRYQPRARGGAGQILKRMCHITVVLTDGEKETTGDA